MIEKKRHVCSCGRKMNSSVFRICSYHIPVIQETKQQSSIVGHSQGATCYPAKCVSGYWTRRIKRQQKHCMNYPRLNIQKYCLKPISLIMQAFYTFRESISRWTKLGVAIKEFPQECNVLVTEPWDSYSPTDLSTKNQQLLFLSLALNFSSSFSCWQSWTERWCSVNCLRIIPISDSVHSKESSVESFSDLGRRFKLTKEDIFLIVMRLTRLV